MQKLYSTALRAEANNLFREFVKTIEAECKPSNVRALKTYTQTVGRIWETFCLEYVTQVLKWNAWTLNACPHLGNLGLKSRDVGIDLIAMDADSNFVAIQCKFRKNHHKLSWRDVSTFDALCMRSGPWKKRIVMATSHSIQREGQKMEEDVFWGKAYFDRLERHVWTSLAGLGDGNVLGGTTCTSADSMRRARCRWIDKGQDG